MIASMRMQWQTGRRQGASKYPSFRKLVESISRNDRYSPVQHCPPIHASTEAYPLPTCMYSTLNLSLSIDRKPNFGEFGLLSPDRLLVDTRQTPKSDQRDTTRGWCNKCQIGAIEPDRDSP